MSGLAIKLSTFNIKYHDDKVQPTQELQPNVPWRRAPAFLEHVLYEQYSRGFVITESIEPTNYSNTSGSLPDRVTLKCRTPHGNNDDLTCTYHVSASKGVQTGKDCLLMDRATFNTSHSHPPHYHPLDIASENVRRESIYQDHLNQNELHKLHPAVHPPPMKPKPNLPVLSNPPPPPAPSATPAPSIPLPQNPFERLFNSFNPSFNVYLPLIDSKIGAGNDPKSIYDGGMDSVTFRTLLCDDDQVPALTGIEVWQGIERAVKRKREYEDEKGMDEVDRRATDKKWRWDGSDKLVDEKVRERTARYIQEAIEKDARVKQREAELDAMGDD